MRISKFLAVIAWVSLFLLLWLILLYPPIRESRGLVISALIFFGAMAMIASGEQAK